MRHRNELPGAHAFDLTKRLTETESGRDALLRRGVDALNDAALDLVMSDQRRDIIRDQARFLDAVDRDLVRREIVNDGALTRRVDNGDGTSHAGVEACDDHPVFAF